MAASNSWNALLALSVAPRTAEANAGFTNLLTDVALPEPGAETVPGLRPAPPDSRKIAEALIRSMISTGVSARRQPATSIQEAASVAISIPITYDAAPNHPAVLAAPDSVAAEDAQDREQANVSPGVETKLPEGSGSTQMPPGEAKKAPPLSGEVKKAAAQEDAPARLGMFANRATGSSSTGQEPALSIPLAKQESGPARDRNPEQAQPTPPASAHFIFTNRTMENSSAGQKAGPVERQATLSSPSTKESAPVAPAPDRVTNESEPAPPASAHFVFTNRMMENSSAGQEAALSIPLTKEESAPVGPAPDRVTNESEPTPPASAHFVFTNRMMENSSAGQEAALSIPLTKEESAPVGPAPDRVTNESEPAPPLVQFVGAGVSVNRAKAKSNTGEKAVPDCKGKEAAKSIAGHEASPTRRQAANRELPAETRNDAMPGHPQTMMVRALPATAVMVNTQPPSCAGSDNINGGATRIAPESAGGEGSAQNACSVIDGTDLPAAPPPEARVEAMPIPAPRVSAPPAADAPIAFTARLTLSPPDVSPALPSTPKAAAEQSAAPSSKDGAGEKMEAIKKIAVSAGKPREGNAHEDPPPADSEAAEIVRSAPEPAAAIERQVSANRAAETNDAAAPAPRMAEVPMVPPALAPSAPAQQIAVRVSPKDGASVDLHVAERGGEIHVSVRTPDEALQTSLRQDLETLANSLERAGYRAETFTPREIAGGATREGAMQPSNSRGNDSDAPAGGRGGSGNSSNPRQQQQSRGQNAKNWLEELENPK